MGADTFTVPVGATEIELLVVAGAGGLYYNTNYPVTPGSVMNLSVGDGGLGNTVITYNYQGANGGNSTFYTTQASLGLIKPLNIYNITKLPIIPTIFQSPQPIKTN